MSAHHAGEPVFGLVAMVVPIDGGSHRVMLVDGPNRTVVAVRDFEPGLDDSARGFAQDLATLVGAEVHAVISGRATPG